MIRTFNGINLQDAYKTALHELVTEGITTSPRGMETKEFIPGILQVENPLSRIIALPSRKMNIFYAMIETLWYMNGDNEVEPLRYYNKNIANFSDNGETFHGAYGARLIQKDQDLDKSQFGLVYDKLKADPSSRQAVAIIWNPWEDHKPTKDVPCTIGFIFTIRNEKLNMTTIMRSNDIVLGTTYDIFAFTIFQEFLARKLGVGLGYYTHVANSFHIYSNHYEMAWDMIKDTHETLLMPEMPDTSWTTLNELYDIEQMIRMPHYEIMKENIFDKINNLQEYWQQWAMMFLFHRAHKEKDVITKETVYSGLIPTYKKMAERWL